MTTKVLLERLSENRYRATGNGQYALSEEGTNREEALANFQKAATGESATLTEEVVIDIPGSPGFPASDPWAWFAGRLKDEPLLGAYEEGIEKARQEDELNESGDAVIVTGNVRDFARIPGLLIEDWTQPTP